jgi:Family of unknown function (DUF6404)
MASLFDKKLSLAMSMLAARGLLNNNATPIGWKFIRRLGFKVPPLYFWGFKTTWIAYTLLFLFGFSAFEFFRLHWQTPRMNMPSWQLILGGSLVFGLSVAARGLYFRRRFGLPLWQDLNPSA